jgi:hypothetical protein
MPGGGSCCLLVTVGRRAMSHADRTRSCVGDDLMSADAWTAVSSIATVIGVIAAIVLGVIPLVRDRKKASTAYAPPSTISGAPQPMPIIVTEAPVSAPAPTAARPVHPAYSPESRRRIGLRVSSGRCGLS